MQPPKVSASAAGRGELQGAERAITWLWPWLGVQGRQRGPAPCGLSEKQERRVSFIASLVYV